MTDGYYKPCRELNACNELMNKYWNKEQYDKCFEGHLKLAEETAYALAECQVGYFFLEGIGTEKDLAKALYWTTRSAEHGDRDGQCNLAWIFEEGLCGEKDIDKAKLWYKKAAQQNHDLAIDKCEEYGIELD